MWRPARIGACAVALVAVLAPLASRPFADQQTVLGVNLNQQTNAAGTGTIRGRVELPPVAAIAQRPNISDAGAPAHALHESPQQAVIYLETAPRGAFDQPDPRHATLDQRNETFVPHVLAITTGTTVDFPNSDRIYHNVFSLSKVRSFDLGRYASGKSRSVRFDRAGTVRVFCEIHSHMNAFILVFNHPFFAVTDAEGRYRIDGIPAGSYNVAAWNERVTFESKPVVVTDGGSTPLDFAPK